MIYDIIIVGSGIGGLTAAALLAKEGSNVGSAPLVRLNKLIFINNIM